jgi:glycogen debranching enzyme
MNDGGLLLASGKGADPAALARNALWYNALAILAEELRKVGDHTGDHFDRLAGRFRRSFMKSFWCEPHQSFCDATERQREDHAAAPLAAFNPDQLLLLILPMSAIPRTKQRQIVDLLRQRQLAPLGLRIPQAPEERCLNLASAAAVALYEALRQQRAARP